MSKARMTGLAVIRCSSIPSGLKNPFGRWTSSAAPMMMAAMLAAANRVRNPASSRSGAKNSPMTTRNANGAGIPLPVSPVMVPSNP